MDESSAAHTLASELPRWQMPLRPEHFTNRSPLVTQQERNLLCEYGAIDGQLLTGWRAKKFLDQLERFDRPFMAVARLNTQTDRSIAKARRHIFLHMARTGTAFWAWSRDEWAGVIETVPVGRTASGARFWMINLAYLASDLLYIGASTTYGLMADAMFRRDIVDTEVNRLRNTLVAAGYTASSREWHSFRWLCALAMLVNRTPYMDRLTADVLVSVQELLATIPSIARVRGRQMLMQLQTALCRLDILDEPAVLACDKVSAKYPPALTAHDTTIDPTWLAWVRAFYDQTPMRHEKTKLDICYNLLTAGRWLKQAHPDVNDPLHWDEMIAAAYVTYTCQALRGDQTRPSNLRHARFRDAPQPLSPGGIDSRLRAMRSLFRHLQRRPYKVDDRQYPRLQIMWLPNEAFATPADVQAARQPNPRDISEDLWFKLIWAACTLSKDHLLAPKRTSIGALAENEQCNFRNRSSQYPLAYYRAAALVWVSAARRSDEIRRLQYGCVSREWAPEMRDEQDNQVEPSEELCYVRVPTNKMTGEFYVPIPAYVADAIEVWESVRPKDQPPIIDRKTGKPTRYLFQYRNELMGAHFLNEGVIPLLCSVAGFVDEHGVPLKDAVGRITSHRGRATTATWMSKLGMSPSDIGRLLGHTNPTKSLPWYLREDKQRLGRAYRKANPLERCVAAVLDTNAQANGEPCIFYYLADGPDGRPRMCGNPHFDKCLHQLMCVECDAYVDHEMAEIIEKREGALIVHVPVPLPPQLVTELNNRDNAEGDRLINDAYPPPPTLPSPAFHFNKKVPMRPSATQGETLQQKLVRLEELVAKKQSKVDRRSASMQALLQEIAEVKASITPEEEGASSSPVVSMLRRPKARILRPLP